MVAINQRPGYNEIKSNLPVDRHTQKSIINIMKSEIKFNLRFVKIYLHEQNINIFVSCGSDISSKNPIRVESVRDLRIKLNHDCIMLKI